MWVPALVVLVSLSDIAPPSPLRVKPAAECSSDTDCGLSTFEGCCSGNCCPREPHAVSKRVNEAARCVAVECAMRDCAAERCAATRPASDLVAACEAGRCVARVKTATPPDCRADGECVVIEVNPPGSCCPENVAVPATQQVKLGRREVAQTGVPEPKPGPFGLSEGKSSPTPTACGRCQRLPPATAACRAGRCTVVPRR